MLDDMRGRPPAAFSALGRKFYCCLDVAVGKMRIGKSKGHACGQFVLVSDLLLQYHQV